MNTPTTNPAQQAAEQFRADLRADLAEIMDELHSQRAELTNIRADLESIRAGLTQAASQPAATIGQTESVTMTRITRTRTSGKWYYKMQGGRYMKRGVTVWDEILKAMELDPESIEWDTQDGYTFPQPLTVTVLLKEYTDETSGELKTTPQKVTGRI